MSDITKKIFSIEQTETGKTPSEPSKSDLIRTVSQEPISRIQKPVSDDVPDFVTRESITPRPAPPGLAEEEEDRPPKGAGWLVLGFAVLYVVAAGLYFGFPLLSETASLVALTGLGLLLTLPLILLFLLWRTLRHLGRINYQNVRLSRAADILVTPDQEALKRTDNLANGIRAQISKLNSGLADTVEALQGVQIAVTRESQTLDAAGAVLASRSEDAGRNLTLQRQALESMSATFETRMGTLSSQITDASQALDELCTAAETKLLTAGEAIEKASGAVEQTVEKSAAQISEKITSLEDTSRNIGDVASALTTDLNKASEDLNETAKSFTEGTESFEKIRAQAESQLSDLQSTIGQGYQMLSELRDASELRASTVSSHYEALSAQMKKSEDDTLAAQGQTTRMVESNLAQMRRDFSRMETGLQALQAKLNNLREASESFVPIDKKPTRLNLMPLDTDFPPVEPPRQFVKPDRVENADGPLNLGMDLEIQSEDAPLVNFQPEVITRPGDISPKKKGRGFGRRTDKEEKSGWRWRDMLGTLERPDMTDAPTSPLSAMNEPPIPHRDIDGVALLSALQLTPAAIVDEGTVVDATQARINSGEPGLTALVSEKLPEAVAHLKDNLEADETLKADLRLFTTDFAKMIGNTPPTAPALRAALGSPEGRAYLLCAAAFKPELRA